jgi:hypothetical protein
MIGPTDLLHPSPAPHFKTFQVFLISCPKYILYKHTKNKLCTKLVLFTRTSYVSDKVPAFLLSLSFVSYSVFKTVFCRAVFNHNSCKEYLFIALITPITPTRFKRSREIAKGDYHLRDVRLSVSPLSVRMGQLGSHYTDFLRTLNLIIFRKSVKKILFFSLFHRAFWFTKFFHTKSSTFTYNYVLVF